MISCLDKACQKISRWRSKPQSHLTLPASKLKSDFLFPPIWNLLSAQSSHFLFLSSHLISYLSVSQWQTPPSDLQTDKTSPQHRIPTVKYEWLSNRSNVSGYFSNMSISSQRPYEEREWRSISCSRLCFLWFPEPNNMAHSAEYQSCNTRCFYGGNRIWFTF